MPRPKSRLPDAPYDDEIGRLCKAINQMADLHGFGLQNVKTALKKYDSFYDMAYEDGYFAFTIEMENDLPSATKNSFFAT